MERSTSYCIHCEIHGHCAYECQRAIKNITAADQEKVVVPVYCGRCRLNNHSYKDCKWRKPEYNGETSKKWCTHYKRNTHNNEECWTLKRLLLNKKQGTIDLPSTDNMEAVISEEEKNTKMQWW